MAPETSPDLGGLAEVSVAAAAMLTPGFWEAALQLPEPDDFDDEDLAALWTGILEAVKAGPRPPSKIAVAVQLRELGWNDKRCFSALARATDQVGYLKLPEAIDQVKLMLDRRLRRRAEAQLKDTLKELSTTADVQATVQRHERSVADLASRADGADNWVRGDQLTESRVERIETGLHDLDHVNGGLPVSELTLLAGRTGMGKTAMAVALMRNVSRRGLGVACNSLEMQALSLIHRMAAAEAYEPGPIETGGHTWNPHYADYERNFLDRDLLKRFEHAKRSVRQLPILWDDKKGRTIGQLKLGARRVKSRFEQEGRPFKLWVVDHLGHIRPDRDRNNRNIELGEVTSELMAIADDLKVSVLCLAQLNRDVEKRPEKRPLISDLRESGRIEEDAHTILLLYRPAYYDDRARERGEDIDTDRADREKLAIEVDFAKNRGGPIKRVQLFCEVGCNAILDRSEGLAHAMRPLQGALI